MKECNEKKLIPDKPNIPKSPPHLSNYLFFTQSEYRVDELSITTTIQLSLTRGLTSLIPDPANTPPSSSSLLLGPVTGAATLSYALVTGTALEGEDFVAGNGSVSFSPGATHATIPIQILSDSEPEVMETFKVSVRVKVKVDL